MVTFSPAKITNVFQLNTHKSTLPLATLIDEKFKGNCNIALIQEPPAKDGRLLGVPPPLSSLQTTIKPRAAIIHNPSLEIWQLPHLSDGDCQTAIWHNGKATPIILISAYWDITFPDIPTKIVQAVSEAITKRYKLLLAIDANAHHPAWGSPEANPRGTLFESFLTNFNLQILNEGNTPTFVRKNCATHIDITITNNSLLPQINSWAVLEEDMFSDHACLHTQINQTIKHKRSFPNYKKTNWSLFTNILEKADWSISTVVKTSDIDTAVENLTNRLNDAIKQSTPTIYITGTHKSHTWWSEDLRQMRRKVRSLKNAKTPTATADYVKEKAAYQKAIRKAKRDSWLSFTSSCESISDTSKLTRILTKPKSQPLGLTVKSDGSATWNPVDSFQNIMNTLFPDSNTKQQPTNQQILTNNQDNTETEKWINTTTVLNHIKALPPNKAPGPDKVTDRMLKHLPQQVITYLTSIYQNIINYSYVPKIWCTSKAIFIPKLNKPKKEDPKSFRPICLSNIMFKILEKLIQAYLEKEHIYPHKLSHRQHGFRPNKSTLTALSTLVNFIETNNHRNQQTLAVFLDIHGAFDNISPMRAINVLAKWGTPKHITDTLQNYYAKREITTVIQPINKTIKIYPTKGTAQGNVLSPMLWNCVIDRVGQIMDKHNIDGSMFADDVVLAATSNNIQHTTATIQQVLNEIEAWANEEGLKFNVSKSHAILFYNHYQKDPPQYCPLYLNNQLLTYQNNTTYLGVLLTDQLKWLDHFKRVFDRAKRDMVRINKALLKQHGPSPKLIHWIYTGVIRPKITYAAHIWCGSISNYIFDKKSRQIQRWALTKLGPIRENTPTAGLEIITKTIPLHIHLQEISLKTMHNFLAIGFTQNPPPKGHLNRWQTMLRTFIPLALAPSDKGLKLSAPQFLNRSHSPLNTEGAEVYTDGSKMGPNCGSGFVLKWGDQTRLGLNYNGQHYTVFLSEIKAIALAVEKLLTEKIPTHINIYSDCTSAIAAILAPRSNSKAVHHCWSLLQKLDKHHKWSLSWVKAHVGISGNETADILAKKATQLSTQNPNPNLPIAPIHVQNAITKFSNANWDTYWNGRADCRQTKLWFPTPNPKESKFILKLNRNDFGLITRWLTGHCFLARHESLINNEDPTCNKCFMAHQTPWHLLKECPATRAIRANIPPDHWTTGTILQAIKQMDFLEVLPETSNYRNTA
jgi:ribonuclease HI